MYPLPQCCARCHFNRSGILWAFGWRVLTGLWSGQVSIFVRTNWNWNHSATKWVVWFPQGSSLAVHIHKIWHLVYLIVELFLCSASSLTGITIRYTNFVPTTASSSSCRFPRLPYHRPSNLVPWEPLPSSQAIHPCPRIHINLYLRPLFPLYKVGHQLQCLHLCPLKELLTNSVKVTLRGYNMAAGRFQSAPRFRNLSLPLCR